MADDSSNIDVLNSTAQGQLKSVIERIERLEEDKAAIRKKGYDLTKIMNELAKSKESILRIVGDDGSIIEIWIE